MLEIPWAQEECGRICELIMDANTGIAQQIIEDKFDLLDLMSPEQMSTPDDLGLTIQFLTVYYDKPAALQYLHKRGVDFAKFCDPMNFGTPMYYAIAFGRYSMIRMLDQIGISVGEPCDCLGLTPMFHADRLDDKSIRQLVTRLSDKKGRAIHMVRKNLEMRRQRKIYLRIKKAAQDMQRMIRGFVDRRRVAKKRYKIKMKALNKQLGLGIEDSDSDAESVAGSRRPSQAIQAAAVAQLNLPAEQDHSGSEREDTSRPTSAQHADGNDRAEMESARVSPDIPNEGIAFEPSAERLMAEYDDEDEDGM